MVRRFRRHLPGLGHRRRDAGGGRRRSPAWFTSTMLALNVVVGGTIVFTLLALFAKQRRDALDALRSEQAKSENLLLNILPRSIAERLKARRSTIADQFSAASILFADVVDFTPLDGAPRAGRGRRHARPALFATSTPWPRGTDSRRSRPSAMLHGRRGRADAAARSCPGAGAAWRSTCSTRCAPATRSASSGWSCASASTPGPVVAGVIGRKRFLYDLWGDAVNTASRMESHGTPGRIQITRATYELLEDEFECEPRGHDRRQGQGRDGDLVSRRSTAEPRPGSARLSGYCRNGHRSLRPSGHDPRASRRPLAGRDIGLRVAPAVCPCPPNHDSTPPSRRASHPAHRASPTSGVEGYVCAPMPVFALWSAPRARSTAFFRSMVEPGDMLALHEPFWNLLGFGETDVDGRTFEAAASLLAWLRDETHDVNVFLKDTTDHRYGEVLVDRRFLAEARHTFLIRRPEEIAASYYALWPDMRIDEVGLEALHELHAAVRDAGGHPPVVIDSDDLVARPEATMAAYCAAVELPFIPRALTWAPGERPSGGGPPAGTRTSAPAPGSSSASARTRHRQELGRVGALRRSSPAVLRAAPRTAARRRRVGANGGLLTHQPARTSGVAAARPRASWPPPRGTRTGRRSGCSTAATPRSSPRTSAGTLLRYRGRGDGQFDDVRNHLDGPGGQSKLDNLDERFCIGPTWSAYSERSTHCHSTVMCLVVEAARRVASNSVAVGQSFQGAAATSVAQCGRQARRRTDSQRTDRFSVVAGPCR